VSSHSTDKFFDSYAEAFSDLYSNRHRFPQNLINRYLRRSMRVRFERTMAGCQPINGLSVLDIGCGPGHYAIALARQGAARVVGIDFAPRMIELARKRAVAAGVAGACEFLLTDLMEYTPDRQFDFTIAMGFMDYVADPVTIVQRIFKLTKSTSFLSFPASGGILAWQRRLRYRCKCDLYLYTEKQVRQLIDSIDTSDTTIERIGRDIFVTLRRH
jgi:2-polyprenyl-3-methyl-5-hydroxy-6-metoxy-1,4-benzoquinol methylase